MTTGDRYAPPPECAAWEALPVLNNAAQREDVLTAATDLLKHWDAPALSDVQPIAHYVNRLRLAVEKAQRASA
jgi:hypothetical protein